MIMKNTGMKMDALLERTGTIIVTMGEQGSKICSHDGEISIPAVRAKIVKDPTGAGDSYRGGLISGLIQGKDIEESARMGSVCASFAVECYGTQEYTFSPEDFNKRLS
jgi:adenosine kinase